MKKILALITILACSATLYAQKYLEVYHGGEVIGSLMATDVDSIRVTGDDTASRRIHFFAAGMEKAFLISDIDSIKVNRSGDEPFVYLGVVGFNQALYDMPIDILANSTSSRYSSFVNSLMRKDGTLLYYGVEHALDLLSQYEFTTPLTSVNLITFTDGLDQGSLMMNSSYTMEPDYLNALNQRIHATTVRGLPITAYSLGLRGNDVSDYAQFRANLQQLASDESKAIEVSSMYDVQNRLQEIAEQIISISNRQTVSARIPGTSNGTRIRFTFDGNSPEYSTIFIEGTFNLADRSLRDVTYHGMRSTSGSTVRGEQDGIFVTFTFSNLYRTDGNGLIPTSYIRQYNQAPSSDTWQRNSEFTPDNNTQTTVTHSGAAIMLVLDCSNSLGSQFGNMQSYASSFISRVANNAVPFNIETPTNVSASLADDEFVVNVSWDAVKYAEFYKVYRRSSNGSFTMVADSVKATSWKDEKPLSGNNYYRIYASGHGLTSNSSNTSDVVKCALEAPTNVSASLADDEFVVNVSWDAVKYAEFYKVYRSSSSNGSFTMVADSVKATSWIDEKPLSGNNYYRIYASGLGLTSSASNTSDVVKCALEAPTNVSASLADDEFVVNVSWDAVKYAEFYKVYRSSSNGSFTMVADSVKATSWKDEKPLSGNNYYRIYASGHGLTSNSSNTSDVVKCALEAPTNVSAVKGDGQFTVNVTWDAVKYAEFYKVYRSSSSNGSFTMVADSVKATSWKDEKPLSGNNYYRIYASGHGLTSSASNTSDVVKCALEAPTNVSAVKGDGQFTVNVTWDAVKYAEFYKVYLSSSSNGSFTMVADSVKATSWTDESSGYGFRYYKVSAVGHGITSEMSAVSNVVNCNHVETENVANGIKIVLNGVSFTMIKVEAGTFQMGSISGDSNVRPVHQVTLTNDYYIGETEVTQELWKAVMGSNPSYFTSSDQLPVEEVSWNDCQTFITKLNELTGKNFRLPTEAEWEFAARGGNASQGYTYSGSNSIGDVAWYSNNSSSKTHEVATKAPNELGIYDMSGNVWEWCQDWYDSYSSEAQTNPTGSPSGSDRVRRGGSWYNYVNFCRVADRGYNTPDNRYGSNGLRLAL